MLANRASIRVAHTGLVSRFPAPSAFSSCRVQASMASSTLPAELSPVIEALQAIVPPLSSSRHKGQAGIGFLSFTFWPLISSVWFSSLIASIYKFQSDLSSSHQFSCHILSLFFLWEKQIICLLLQTAVFAKFLSSSYYQLFAFTKANVV